MKKQQREVYLELSKEVDAVLCSFCKYSRWDGGCEEASCDCQHPLEDYFSHSYGYYGLEPGCDCWGFRPVVRLADIADIVGIILGNGFREWSWDLTGDQIYVYGSVKSQ